MKLGIRFGATADPAWESRIKEMLEAEFSVPFVALPDVVDFSAMYVRGLGVEEAADIATREISKTLYI